MDSQVFWRVILWIDETDVELDLLYLELNKHGPTVRTWQWKCDGVWGLGLESRGNMLTQEMDDLL